MKLNQITFHLENCDHITIDGKYIGDFLVDQIERTIRRTAYNSIDCVDTAKCFVIEIHKDADKPHYELGDFDSRTSVFNRLIQWYDICQIDFDLTDGSDPRFANYEHYSYFLDWTGDDGQINEAQSVYISDLGNIYIVVKANSTIDDYFIKEQINMPCYTENHFEYKWYKEF